MESVGRHPSFSSSLLDEIYRSIDIDIDDQLYTRTNYGYQYHQQDKVVVRRKKDYLNSTSTSCHSISSSEAEAEAESASSRPKKPVQFQFQYNNTREKKQGKFVKTKSRAMKMYGDLKQPISPGGRLATFLNSLFTITPKSKSFSQTPSSKPKLSDNKIPSVREEKSNLQSAKFVTKMPSSDKNRRIEEAARNLLKNYQRKVECEFDLIRNSVKSQDEEEDDDDDGSHTSSDLFELENLSAIGMDNYRDELPVYETTHLDW